MESNQASWQGPLTQNQQDIYYDQQNYPDCPLYNVGGYISLPAIDVAVLQLAHERVIAAHDVFSLRVGQNNGQLYQWTGSDVNSTLTLIDFSKESEPELRVEQWLEALFQKPQKLDNRQLFSAYLVKLNKHSFYYVGLAHHIIMDGWGFSNWARDLGKFYNAMIADQCVELETTRWQTVVEQDQAYLQSDKLHINEAFFRESLAAFPGSFLSAKYRPQFQNQAVIPGGRKNIVIGRARHQKLISVAKTLKVPVSQLYFAIIAHYFSRAYDKSKICFGFPVHNRKGHAQKQLLGTFASVSPIILGQQECDELSAWCQHIAVSIRKVLKNQSFPVGLIRKRILNLTPDSHLYDVTFNYLDLNSAFEINEHEAALHYCSHGHEQLPIKFTVWDHGSVQDVVLQVDFNRAYFNEWDVDLLEQRLSWLFEQVIESHGKVSLEQLCVLPEDEKILLNEQLQGAEYKGTSSVTLFDHVRKQAEKTPERVALYDGTTAYSYAQCVAKAELLAGVLHSQHLVAANQLVGVCMARHVDLVVAILAIHRLGAAYVPLDATYPAQRIEYMIKDAQLALILVDDSSYALDSLGDAKRLRVSDQVYDTAVTEIPETSPGHLAYIIYTSGSTGKPKGVMISHLNALSLLNWAQQQYTEEQLSYVLAATSVCFDLSVFEIFAPLSVGGTVRLVDNVLALGQIHDAEQITLLNTVPSAIESLLTTQELPQSLQIINLAGEPLITDTVRRLKARLPAVRVFDLYGPSEDTTYSTCGERFSDISANIGRPLPGTLTYIFDSKGRLTPVGCEGELYLGGPGLSDGYFGQPELSAQKFLSMPSPIDGRLLRLYKTGDQVRWQADGTLQYLGRLDSQVKIRGFRIELDEIKNVLKNVSGVADIQLLVAGERQDAKLVAFVILAKTHEHQAQWVLEQLSRAAQRQLPDYMAPNHIQLCDEFARLPNGKLDPAALLAKFCQYADAIVEPTTELETQLRAIWSQLLQQQAETISTEDNFFRLGGNSLLCTQMVHLLNKQIPIKVSLAEIFSAPTIKSLASQIQSDIAQTTPKSYSLSTMPKPQHDVPLSYAQYRIWFMHEMHDVKDALHIPIKVEIARALNLAQLQRVLNRLAEQHLILSTSFVSNEDGDPHQRAIAVTEVPLRFIDLRSQPAYLQASLCEAECQKDAMREFNLAEPPLLRAMVIQQDVKHYIIQFTFHHIICDGWSGLQFLDLFFAQLEAEAANAQHELHVPEFKYTDYVLASRAFLSTPAAQQQVAFWRNELTDFPQPLALPWRHKGGQQGASTMADEVGLILPTQLSSAIKLFAQHHSCTVFNVIHTSLAIVLSRLTGQRKLSIGVPCSGRHIEGTESMLGVFLNLLPLQTSLPDNTTFSELVAANSTYTSSVFVNQDIPFETLNVLANELNQDRRGAPLFNVMLNMLNLPNTLNAYKDVTLVTDTLSKVPSKFDLTLYVTEEDNAQGETTFRFFASFDEQQYRADLVRNALLKLVFFIEQAIKEPQQVFSDIKLEAMDGAVSALQPVSLPAESLNDAFARMVAMHAQSPSLMFSGKTFTYWELDKLSDHYAYLLQQQGVRKGDAVAIFAQRTPNFIVSVLAVLKAGAYFALLSEQQSEYVLKAQLNIIKPAAWLVCSDKNISLAHTLGLAHKEGLLVELRELQAPFCQLDAVSCDADTLAYIAFTSGTTGEPKAIYGQHASISAFIPVMQQRYQFDSTAHVGMLSSLTHDPVLRDIFFALGSGACLHIPTEATYRSADVLTWLRDNRINMVNMTPSYARQFTAYSHCDLPQLTHVFFGGEPLTDSDVKQIRALCEHVRVTNLYGATESGRALAAFDIDSDSNEACSPQFCEHGVYPVGQGLAGVRLVILNENNQLCSVGEVGQIGILSEHLPLGYPGAAQSSKYLNLEQGRVYLTGDKGRYTTLNMVECLGREDQQVKLRGYRIELEEITFHLKAHPSVMDAYVFVSNYNSDTASLIAVITCKSQTFHNNDELNEVKGFLSSRLPVYMLPASFVMLDHFPMTLNNKVDHAGLRKKALAQLAHQQHGSNSPAKTPLEHELHSIWSELFEQESLCVTSNFYALGGNSLLATKLIARIQRQYELEFTYQDFLTDSSIRMVAKRIEDFLNSKAVTQSNRQDKKITLSI
ncbi:non-ribosomal peptide synthetase [Pseudoalteromonas rubra]|uniref:non-ribosomal peptide synthetase n=1 Tax=Pseudoalteromonas rubra TaxID=43658 RepID=UPI000F768DF7|nr:non-ribosomal peptide synthetase [Pseudoalteromonas rubra]